MQDPTITVASCEVRRFGARNPSHLFSNFLQRPDMHQRTCDEFNSDWALMCNSIPLRLERYTAQHVVSTRMTFVVDHHPLEGQMSKRTPATASKHAHSPKITAK